MTIATTKPQLPLQIDLDVHVLPILELCRYPGLATSATTSLLTVGVLKPEFGKSIENTTANLPELRDMSGGDVIAAGLHVAIDLLRLYMEQPEANAGFAPAVRC